MQVRVVAAALDWVDTETAAEVLSPKLRPSGGSLTRGKNSLGATVKKASNSWLNTSYDWWTTPDY